jgi:hypothetical protein
MASFLQNLKNFFIAPAYSSTTNFITFSVRCNRCGEEIDVKVRRSSDISRLGEGEEGPSGSAFLLRKEILGNKCNNLIYLTAYFGESYNLISSEISGGKIIEYK